IAAEEGPSAELLDMERRFWASLVLGIPVFLLAMAPMAWRPSDTVSVNWLELLLTTPVVFWCGWPFFQRAWASIINRSANMFTLIALGVGVAYSYSVLLTIAFVEAGGTTEPYFETAAAITVLVLLGQVLELRARGRTSAAIKRLLGLAPKTARLVH